MKLRVVILPGDGIGPEVTRQAVRVLSTVSDVCGYEFRFETHRIGGAAIEQDGTPLPESTLEACLKPTPFFSARLATAASTISPVRNARGRLAGIAAGARRIRQSASGHSVSRPSLTARRCSEDVVAARTCCLCASCSAGCISPSRAALSDEGHRLQHHALPPRRD